LARPDPWRLPAEDADLDAFVVDEGKSAVLL
jgi:hypothetical protein